MLALGDAVPLLCMLLYVPMFSFGAYLQISGTSQKEWLDRCCMASLGEGLVVKHSVLVLWSLLIQLEFELFLKILLS